MHPDFYIKLIDRLRGYGYTPFKGGDGQPYAVQLVTPDLPAGQRADIDTLLAGVVPHETVSAGEMLAHDPAHLTALLAQKPHLTNGLSFVFDRFTQNGGGLSLHARLGRYYDMLATCDALDQEMQRHIEHGTDTPLRDRLHTTHDPLHLLHNGRDRSAVIGVATAIVFPKDGHPTTIIGRRAGSLATDPGRYHVLPAFVFQPSGPPDLIAGEWSLSWQILREFGEEAFAMPEFADWPEPVTRADYFADYPPVADLRAMLADGRAVLELTGVVVSLLTLRPEVCAVLVIYDEGWYPRWRAELDAAMHTERQETLYLPVMDDTAFPADLHTHGVPQGMAAFWLGVARARELLNGRR